MHSLVVLKIAVISIIGIKCEDVPCAVRQMKFGAVCVCNSSYCDTVERPPPLARGGFYRYTTSSDSPGFTRTSGTFNKGLPAYNENTTVFTIDMNKTYQEIFGFGGAFTDSSGSVLDSVSTETQSRIIEAYFSEKGIEYNMGRLLIGATDFSLSLYSNDDVMNDGNLNNFNLTEEEYRKIFFIQRAMKVSPHKIKLIAVAFSSPRWMKTNNTWLPSYIKREYFHSWALYHIKYFDAYAEHGIKMWMLTQGNEVSLDLFWPRCLVIGINALPHDHITWIRDYLAPLLATSNHSDVKLSIMDDMRLFSKLWLSRFALHPEAYRLVDGICYHWYVDWFFPQEQLWNWTDRLHDRYPDKLFINSETSVNIIFGGEALEPGSWLRGAYYMYNILENINHWCNGYLDWNLILDTAGGPNTNLPTDGAIIVNASSDEFFKNPIFYGMGHFSKFIPPGSYRADVQGNKNFSSESLHLDSDSVFLLFDQKGFVNKEPSFKVPVGVFCTATSNSDNSSTVIVLNTNEYDVNVTIIDTVSGYITDSLTANSINTFVYWPGNI